MKTNQNPSTCPATYGYTDTCDLAAGHDGDHAMAFRGQTITWTNYPTRPRCEAHPAYEADYCPVCGTARVIGGTV